MEGTKNSRRMEHEKGKHLGQCQELYHATVPREYSMASSVYVPRRSRMIANAWVRQDAQNEPATDPILWSRDES